MCEHAARRGAVPRDVQQQVGVQGVSVVEGVDLPAPVTHAPQRSEDVRGHLDLGLQRNRTSGVRTVLCGGGGIDGQQGQRTSEALVESPGRSC